MKGVQVCNRLPLDSPRRPTTARLSRCSTSIPIGAYRRDWPPVEVWAAAKDRTEARRIWCEEEKTSFTAVKLDAQMRVDLYFLCPANGGVNMEMVSTINGLDSVIVKLETSGSRLKGTLRTGQGNCPGPDGKGDVYCTPTGDYSFDVPLSK